MKPPFDVKLYLVLDPIQCGGLEGMVNTTIAAVKSGVTIVQLRAESMDKRAWYEAGIALKHALRAYAVPLIVNNHIDVALAINADGVHIGQRDLPVAEVRRMIGKDKILGLSVSNEEQMKSVDWESVDYLGIGPVFPTTSKKNAPPALGIDILKTVAALKRLPAVAIGGITVSTARAVKAAGVEGIAVVSAICGKENPSAATRALIEAIDDGVKYDS